MKRKRKIKDGHIVVENPLFQELPTHEVTIKSGRTLYRFTGSYDGERSRNYVKGSLAKLPPSIVAYRATKNYRATATALLIKRHF
ncbi:hypothetical protein D7X88_13365 [bacterium C-53]|nr:hypothetical protein [Lachnospiraceae bacterium]RKJ08788.1 hypothetical protein D7X88_13365 [bacterium C-53]